LIIRGVIDVMQGHGKLYHAKAGAKMPAMHAYYINNILPELITDLVKLFAGKTLEIFRRVDCFEQGPGCYFHGLRYSAKVIMILFILKQCKRKSSRGSSFL